jgi:flagellar biosynthetic protein FliQ
MDQLIFFDVMREGLWIGVAISLPILVAGLITGLVVGLFQALTSIQEMTLTFVPKLAAMLIVFWATMNYMTYTLTSFFSRTIIPLIVGG